MRLLNPEGISNFENEIKKESFIIACNSDNNMKFQKDSLSIRNSVSKNKRSMPRTDFDRMRLKEGVADFETNILWSKTIH